MSELETPRVLIDAAKKLGVDLDSNIKYDAKRALIQISDHFNGDSSNGDSVDNDDNNDGDSNESTFGFNFGKLASKIKTNKHTGGINSFLKLKTKVPIVGFIVPPKMSIAQAMGGADKLLGDTRIKNMPHILAATKAMASLGDPAAKRGLITLAAVSKIRIAKKTPPGKKAIPITTPVNTKMLTKVYDKATVFNMAQKKLKDDAINITKMNFFQKVRMFFGFKV